MSKHITLNSGDIAFDLAGRTIDDAIKYLQRLAEKNSEWPQAKLAYEQENDGFYSLTLVAEV